MKQYETVHYSVTILTDADILTGSESFLQPIGEGDIIDFNAGI